MAKEKEIKINSVKDDELTARGDISPEQNGNEIETETEAAPEEEKIELTEEEVLRARVTDLEDKLLRAAAEYENYKKRLMRQCDDLIQAATDRSLVETLEVIDNFERAFEHGGSDADSFRNGMELIFNQLKELLLKNEVKPIDAIGQKFNPELHEAMMRLDSDEYEEGYVAMEMAKGYQIGKRVLRHSKVGVSNGQPKKEEHNE